MADELKTNNTSRNLILGIIISGILGLVTGVLVFAGMTAHIASLSASSGALTGLIHKSSLVLAESLLCGGFSIAGCVLYLQKKNHEFFKEAALLSLGGKIIAEALLFIPYSKRWYYLLDPNGAAPGGIFLVVISGIQLILIVCLSVCFRKKIDTKKYKGVI